jgi:oligopeptidase A
MATIAVGNPLLADGGLPEFGRIEPAHVVPAVEQVVQQSQQRLEAIEPQFAPNWERSVALVEELDLPFERAWKPVGHLFGVKNSPELRTAYDTVLPKVVEFGLRVRQSEPLYRALRQMRDGDGWQRLDEAQRRIVHDRIQDAELAGIALPAAQRERFNQIEQELSQLGTQFANHVLDATKAYGLEITDLSATEGWPQTLRQLAAQSYNTHSFNTRHIDAAPQATPERGPWRITLESPLFVPFMEHCRRRELREQVYRAYITRAAAEPFDNAPLINRILRLRREKAALLGYENYAQVSLARKMASTVPAVQDMYRQLRTASWEPAHRDLDDLMAFKRQQGDDQPLALWDVAFWAERLRENRYAYTDEEIRPYFPLERVLDGLFGLLARLFGVTVTQKQDGVSVWHPDVRFYEVFDEAGRPIAAFYLDPYSRPENKRGGAWMDDCLGRRPLKSHWQLPVAHLVCNQTPPVGDIPALMTFREVETLFHEMGHGLQHMLTRVDHPDAAGINGIEWDAVELPSQFMENWCYHRPTLLGMTRHYRTGEPLPEDLFQKICAARNYRAASDMLRQLMLGMTDIELHTTFDPDGTTTAFDVQRRVAEETSVLPLLPEDRFLCSFQHIFAGGYAAGYYSYKWAEILSADAFSAFEEAGLDDSAAVAQTGRRFRDTVLALGGGRHPMDVFREFRGREPRVEPLLRQTGLVSGPLAPVCGGEG